MTFKKFQLIGAVVCVIALLSGLAVTIYQYFLSRYYFADAIWSGIYVFFGFVILYLPIAIILRFRVTESAGLPWYKRLFYNPKLFGSDTKTSIAKRHEKRTDLATIGQRLGAYIIDVGIVVAIVVCITMPTFFMSDNSVESLYWIAAIPVLIMAMAYLFFRDGFKGQGIGKRLLRIYVVRLDTNQPIGFWRSTIRYAALRILGPIELIVMLVEMNHRRVGDYLANCVVIQQKK